VFDRGPEIHSPSTHTGFQKCSNEAVGAEVIPPSRKAAVLAEYILSIGLPLQSKLDEFYQIEIQPAVNAAKSDGTYKSQADYWRRAGVRIAPVGATTEAKERALTALTRQLRDLAYIAVGRREVAGTTGEHQIIEPRFWDFLAMSRGSSTVADEQITIRDVHVTLVERLGARQREDLNEWLYEISAQIVGGRGADATQHQSGAHAVTNSSAVPIKQDLRKPGRQPLCGEMEEEMRRRAREGKLLPTLAGEVRALLYMRGRQPDVRAGKSKLPAEGSARNHLRKPYKTLKAVLEARLGSMPNK
jgi:hypothetical protein